MNVKNFLPLDKENRSNHMNFTSSSQLMQRKEKEKKIRKMGEEIRGRMRIGLKSKIQNVRQGYRTSNHSTKSTVAMKPKIKEDKHSRMNILKKSFEVPEPMTNRSTKSVKFEERCDESKLSRKHSSSSILKNGTNLASSIVSEKNSMKSSICSNILRDEQSTQNIIGNKGLREKYERQIQILKVLNKKYSDELYPPIKSSLSYSSGFPSEVKWVRISELFNGIVLNVWNPDDKCTIQCGKYAENHPAIPNCFNTIKTNNLLLEKMFQSQKFSPNGLYFVKINQNNSWKYVIVDDYIPTVKVKNKYQPIFIGVNMAEKSRSLEIWPFLLMKAYAKYYSTYESLLMASEIDFLQELTGCPILSIPVNSQNLPQIAEKLQGFDTIGLVEEDNYRLHPIKKSPSFTYEDSSAFYNPINLSSEIQFLQRFVNVHFISLHKYFYSGFCTIRQNSSKCPLSSLKTDESLNISLRYLKLEDSSDCAFSVVQKDVKHYRGQYKYAWIRMIVVMKEGENGYRWIGGTYKNQKISTLYCSLQAGEYFIILMPEWINQIKDFNLVYMGNSLAKLERKNYKDYGNILMESAMDLAQQEGKLNQINKNICSYNYIHHQLGLIIENINNERPMGDIRIYRSIEGLVRNYPIKALNKQLAIQTELEIKIKSLDHFTVVLGMFGGSDRTFLESFNFGT